MTIDEQLRAINKIIIRWHQRHITAHEAMCLLDNVLRPELEGDGFA